MIAVHCTTVRDEYGDACYSFTLLRRPYHGDWVLTRRNHDAYVTRTWTLPDEVAADAKLATLVARATVKSGPDATVSGTRPF